MKKITMTGVAMLAGLSFAILPLGASRAFAAQPPAALSQQSSRKTHPAPQNSYSSPLKYSGTIVKKNGRYVVKAGMFTFKLSNQKKAQKYQGKQVVVIGKLNPNTNVIKVKKIKIAKG